MLGKMRIIISSVTFRSILFILVFGVLCNNNVTCVGETVGHDQGEKGMSAKRIEEVLKEYTDELMSIPGVVGTGQGLCDDKPCIKVFVIKKTPDLEEKIPSELEGYRTKIEETGVIRPLPENGR
jgi:hypothetical protein